MNLAGSLPLHCVVTTIALLLGSPRLEPGLHGQSPQDRKLRDGSSSERIELKFTLVRSIGSLDGTRDAFGNIWDVALDSRGRIYVADVGQSHVTVFDSAGSFVRTIGRRGSGPGEFHQPMQLGIDNADTLFVYDVGLRRLTKFSPDGQFVVQKGLPDITAVGDIRFSPNGDVVLVGFTPLLESTIHVFDRELTRRRSFGKPAPMNVQFFSESLLGGFADITPAGLILYTQKSPFELHLYKPDGSLLWKCTGLQGETTPPQEVVKVDGDRRQLQWNRFIHSAAVMALSDSLFLNIITDPTHDRRRLDLIDRDCRIRSTSIMDVPFLFVTSRSVGNQRLFGGVRSIVFPQAVVYKLAMK
jgi:6-bladed beta-propeller protein